MKYLVLKYIKVFLLIIFILPNSSYAKSRVFVEKKDILWPAIEKAMSGYSVKNNNIENGIFETNFVTGKAMWKEPQAEKTYLGYSSRIVLRLLKSKKREAYKLIIKKIMKYKPDFFSEEKFVESNGIEEQVILYRINRELEIHNKINKEIEKSTPPENDLPEEPLPIE